MTISITKGDALAGPFKKKTVLVHCCNDLSCLGAGIAGQIRTKYPKVDEAHTKWYEDYFAGEDVNPFVLGQIQICLAEDNFFICNLIGQRDMGVREIDGEKVIPVKHESLREGFLRLRGRVRASQEKDGAKIDIRAPLLGCGLAGSTIDQVYPIAAKVFGGPDFNFTFYAFSDKDFSDLAVAHADHYLDGTKV